MEHHNHPWEVIFRTEGRVFQKPFPRFREVVDTFLENGCQRILDLGSGSGRHTVHLAKAGFMPIGMDISYSGLQMTRAWLSSEKQEAGTLLADMREPFPFRDESFDAVFSTQVIHHAFLAKIRGSIQEIWRVMSPNGLAFITLSARMDRGEKVEMVEPGTFVPLTGSEAGLPHHIFSEEEWKKELNTFQIIDISIRAEGKVMTSLVRKL